MTDQPQINLEHVINILRIRLSEEIYQRSLLEAAYNQAVEQEKTLNKRLNLITQELDRMRDEAANQHTQLSQQLEQTPKHLTTMTDADVKETLGINPLKTT